MWLAQSTPYRQGKVPAGEQAQFLDLFSTD